MPIESQRFFRIGPFDIPVSQKKVYNQEGALISVDPETEKHLRLNKSRKYVKIKYVGPNGDYLMVRSGQQGTEDPTISDYQDEKFETQEQLNSLSATSRYHVGPVTVYRKI